MNEDMLPVGTTVHINPEDIKWNDGDLISREALKKSIKSYADDQYAENEYLGEYAIMDIINNAPAVNNEIRPQGKWIPVSERLPDNETEVLFQYQYGQSMMVGYYVHDFTEYPPEFTDENETGWYDNKDNFICGTDEVIAWQALPEPYKEGEEK